MFQSQLHCLSGGIAGKCIDHLIVLVGGLINALAVRRAFVW